MRACFTLCLLALALILAPGVLTAQMEGTITLENSLNHNTLYIGDMDNAWQYSHQFEHQFDHQAGFSNAFNGAGDSTFYIPVGPTHLQQANTGVAVGDYAGAVEGANLMNLSRSQVTGMFTCNANLAAVGTNQITLNSLVAFAAPAP
uniref:Uncharacterized protein n=1 Tax=Desulfobacca acetoxidans TaxID=60893 RepID=A0A7V4LDK7_9BACT